MTPKEKAEELFNKHLDAIISFLSDNMKRQNAKLCALISVNEILNGRISPHLGWKEVEFWDKVKQEIEKL
jgi:hypothetical protein